ncbi:MAG: YggT family protein [Solirubrobacterales bacterium]
MTAELTATTSILVAVTRVDVANYLSTLLWIYTVLILIKILLSWVPRMPYNPTLNFVIRCIDDVTEPFLGLFRRIVPAINVGGAGLDVSPILAIFALQIVGGIVVNLVAG